MFLVSNNEEFGVITVGSVFYVIFVTWIISDELVMYSNVGHFS